MGKISKTIALFLTLIIAMSCLTLLTVKPVDAQTATPTLEWSKTFSRNVNGLDQGCFAIQTSDEGYVIMALLIDHYYAPHTGGVDNRTSAILKLDALGELKWEKLYPMITTPTFLVQTADSGFLLGGDTQIVKLDAQGNIEWYRSFPFSIRGAIQSSDNAYILVGYTPNSSPKQSIAQKVDAQGNVLWYRTFPSLVNSYTYSILVDFDGNYIIVGQRYGAWLAKIDSDGNLIMNQSYPQLNGDFYSIKKANNDTYIIAGICSVPEYQGLVVSVDSSFGILWNKTFNPPFTPNQNYMFGINSISLLNDNAVISIGSSAQGSVIFLLDTYGNLMWNNTNANPETLPLFSEATATSDSGFIVVGTQNDSISLIKFSIQEPATPTPFLTPDNPRNPKLGVIYYLIPVSFIAAVIALSVLIFRRNRKK